MELFSTDSHFLLVNGNRILYINRHTSQFYSRSGVAHELSVATCLGVVYGFIGKVQFARNCEPRLIFIRERSIIGNLKGCEIYKIRSVIAVPLEGNDDILLEPCPSHYSSKRDENIISAIGTVLVRAKPTTLTAQLPENIQSASKKSEKDDKMERRMLDEFCKMYESESFYYSNDYDLTNSMQRQALSSEKFKDKEKLPLWYGADPKYFWNQYMLSDLIQAQDSIEPGWIIPIIQGFIQFRSVDPNLINIHGMVDVWLISRRCRYRAGTRYLKRGIDDAGNVANYVETEQIMIFKKHFISFVITRGSVPLYWSQPGLRYRPPLHLERSAEENYSAFRHHIEEQGAIYGPLIIINLLDKSGKEKVLGDMFLENILQHNSPEVSYYTFDFHDNCRGMHFENVQILIDKLDEQLKTMNYCWIDSYGIVQTQTGICRVNCVDCLDRTNVVQSFLARHVVCYQLSKLGLISPEFGLPNSLKKTLQHMWANNGDAISKQYSGTSALKGDYTRTGERRIAGALKDGMNSANRYYLNRFRDSTRQAVIDIMLGSKKYVSEDELENEKSIEDRESTAEQLRSVIEDTQKCIIPKFDVILGSWGLINARENDLSAVDVDTILILTETFYYVTGYDCILDSITTTEKVKLSAVTAIELGYEMSPGQGIFTMFANVTSPKPSIQLPSLRVTYMTSGTRRFHQFRSSNMRFFNNVCVPIHQPEEMSHALNVVADTIRIGCSMQGNFFEVKHTGRLVCLPVRAESRDSNSSTGSSASWAQRHMNLNREEELITNSPKLVKLEKSFERFTPKYFRSSSLADARRREEGASRPGVNITDVKVLKVLTEEIRDDSTLSSIPQGIQFDLILPKLVVPQTFHKSRNMDLVLPSCGLVSVPNVTLERPHYAFSPSFIPHQAKDLIDPTGLKENWFEIERQLPCISSSLQRQRYSLPTSSLAAPLAAQSPLAPKITITEPHMSKAQLNPGMISLRLSKSSEDVKLIQDNKASTMLADTATHLRLISPETGRSTSDQDISLSLANSLKGSHSESSIKGVDPSQKFAQAKGNLQFKKEAVLAPLGKLAGYFHPKKIKDSFKLQRKDVFEGTASAEDPEKIRILEERKKKCKSLIVDVQGVQLQRRV